LANW
jgi:hypothetical protein